MDTQDKGSSFVAGAVIGGIVGLCFGVWFCASVLISNWRNYNGISDKISSVLLGGVMYVPASLIFGGIAGYIVLGPFVMLIVWVVASVRRQSK